MTELLYNRQRRQVFTFAEGGLGEKVWEAEPVTRFRFKQPMKNEWIEEQIKFNRPTTGVVFKGVPYIGTSDGFICGPTDKRVRIPGLLVDPDLFIEEFPFTDAKERRAFLKYRKKGIEGIANVRRDLFERVFEIARLVHDVESQSGLIDRYLTGRLQIRGFVYTKITRNGETELYDGSLVGINNTLTGENINPLLPEALYQIAPDKAGFVPAGDPLLPMPGERIVIKDGFEKQIRMHCVDYRSLWDITGSGIWVRDICPRDGSGCSAAKFATDARVTAILHGNSSYVLDILVREKGEDVRKASINLDSDKTPRRLFIRDGNVYGDYGNTIRDFLIDETVFSAQHGHISSVSDSGLCTVLDNGKTSVVNPFKPSRSDNLEGDYIFLSSTPQ